MWYWRRLEISWSDRVRNVVVQRVQKYIYSKKEGRLTGLVTPCVETAFYNTLPKER